MSQCFIVTVIKFTFSSNSSSIPIEWLFCTVEYSRCWMLIFPLQEWIKFSDSIFHVLFGGLYFIPATIKSKSMPFTRECPLRFGYVGFNSISLEMVRSMDVIRSDSTAQLNANRNCFNGLAHRKRLDQQFRVHFQRYWIACFQLIRMERNISRIHHAQCAISPTRVVSAGVAEKKHFHESAFNDCDLGEFKQNGWPTMSNAYDNFSDCTFGTASFLMQFGSSLHHEVNHEPDTFSQRLLLGIAILEYACHGNANAWAVKMLFKMFTDCVCHIFDIFLSTLKASTCELDGKCSIENTRQLKRISMSTRHRWIRFPIKLYGICTFRKCDAVVGILTFGSYWESSSLFPFLYNFAKNECATAFKYSIEKRDELEQTRWKLTKTKTIQTKLNSSAIARRINHALKRKSVTSAFISIACRFRYFFNQCHMAMRTEILCVESD